MRNTQSLLNSSFTHRLFQLPSLPPSPSSSSHSTLPSFLQHALRTNLPQTSTLYLGTHYEYTIQSTLRRYAFSLHRIGGRSDLGIDLLGTWHPHPIPPSTTTTSKHHSRSKASYNPEIRVLVQCKSLKAKITPSIVRELEGTFRTAPPGFRGGNVAGVLVSTREATKGVREALGRSGYPVLWMMVCREGRVRQVLWNGKVDELGLAGLGVDMRYSTVPGGIDEKEIALTWDGEDVPCMDEVERHMGDLEGRWVRRWAGLGVDLDVVSKEGVLDAVERCFPGTRPVTISDEEMKEVVQYLQG